MTKLYNNTTSTVAIEYYMDPTKVDIMEYVEGKETFIAYQCGDIGEASPTGKFAVTGDELKTLESRYTRAAKVIKDFEESNVIVDLHNGETKTLFAIGVLANGLTFGLISDKQCQSINLCRDGRLSTWSIGDVFNCSRLDLTNEDMMAKAIMEYNGEIARSLEAGVPCADPWNGILVVVARKA